MAITSLREKKTSSDPVDFFKIDGAIRRIIAISAYVDHKSIDQLIEFTRRNSDSRARPSLRLFIDKSSSRYSSDRVAQAKLTEANEKILEICDSNSGIYLVQFGSLFHSKAYLIEGNRYGRVIFGSMNFTQNGMGKNEELIILEDLKIGARASANRQAEWIAEYANNLHEKSTKVGSNTRTNFPSCMRQLLLDGTIHYELKEQNPFRFKLHLPEEITKQQADIDVLLEANITDSISIEALIQNKIPIGLGINLQDLSSTRAFWKKFCIETCYGYWSPNSLDNQLECALQKRIDERKPHFDKIKSVLHEKSDEIRNCFLGLHLRITKHLKNSRVENWRFSEKNTALDAWDKWIENVNSKINNEAYYKRLISGISHVPSPDVWGDPLSSEEFEDSFCESIIYHRSKEYSKETSNVVTQAITFNLGLRTNENEPTDKYGLKSLINRWFIDNPESSIISFEE